MVRRRAGGVDHLHAVFPIAAARGLCLCPWSRGASVSDCATPAASCADRGFARVAGTALERVGNPILPDADWKRRDSALPVWRILVLLGASVGLPFFLLAATNPLLQAWFSRAHPGTPPWRLYALSNLGSLLGLLGYPFLLEWLLPLPSQAWFWTAGYLLFAGGIVTTALTPVTSATASTNAVVDRSPTAARALHAVAGARRLRLGAAVAATNQMAQEIAVIPFLWVLPLSLYLLSFILCFESDRWQPARPLRRGTARRACRHRRGAAPGRGRADLVADRCLHVPAVHRLHDAARRARAPAAGVCDTSHPITTITAGGAVGGCLSRYWRRTPSPATGSCTWGCGPPPRCWRSCGGATGIRSCTARLAD